MCFKLKLHKVYITEKKFCHDDIYMFTEALLIILWKNLSIYICYNIGQWFSNPAPLDSCESQLLSWLKSKIEGEGFLQQAWNGSWGSRRLRLLDLLNFRHYKDGKVVTLKHRPPLPPGVFLILIFRGWVDPRAHGSVGRLGKNSQRHHLESIPSPSN
jgi:hypothetical protein